MANDPNWGKAKRAGKEANAKLVVSGSTEEELREGILLINIITVTGVFCRRGARGAGGAPGY